MPTKAGTRDEISQTLMRDDRALRLHDLVAQYAGNYSLTPEEEIGVMAPRYWCLVTQRGEQSR
jgi:hypothetical protein